MITLERDEALKFASELLQGVTDNQESRIEFEDNALSIRTRRDDGKVLPHPLFLFRGKFKRMYDEQRTEATPVRYHAEHSDTTRP